MYIVAAFFVTNICLPFFVLCMRYICNVYYLFIIYALSMDHICVIFVLYMRYHFFTYDICTIYVFYVLPMYVFDTKQ